MQRIRAKNHGNAKCPSVVPFKIFHSKGPFEVDSYEHFGLEWPFSMAVMIVFTPKCPWEGNISRLQYTRSRPLIGQILQDFQETCVALFNCQSENSTKPEEVSCCIYISCNKNSPWSVKCWILKNMQGSQHELKSLVIIWLLFIVLSFTVIVGCVLNGEVNE